MELKHTTSITIDDITFYRVDKIKFNNFGKTTTGIVIDIDPEGAFGSHLRVAYPIDTSNNNRFAVWITDESIISNDTPPKDTPVTFWCGKVVLYRETPVTIKREVYGTGTEPYAEGFDDEGRYYKFRLDELEKLAKPIEGIVKHGRNK